jgi:hypothetical protein
VDFYGYSANKTDRHDITEILLTVTFNTITRNRYLKKATARHTKYLGVFLQVLDLFCIKSKGPLAHQHKIPGALMLGVCLGP